MDDVVAQTRKRAEMGSGEGVGVDGGRYKMVRNSWERRLGLGWDGRGWMGGWVDGCGREV